LISFSKKDNPMDHREGRDEKATWQEVARRRKEERARVDFEARQAEPCRARLMDAIEAGGGEAVRGALADAKKAGLLTPGWIDGRMPWRGALTLAGLGMGGEAMVSENLWPASAMDLAAVKGDVTSMRWLEKSGAHVDLPDQTGRSPLSRAACFGRIVAMKWLLERAANPDGPSPNSDLGDIPGIHVGLSPLAMAVEAGHEEGARLLLAWGANPNARDLAGDTPLISACHVQSLWAVELLAPRSDLDAVGAKGRSARDVLMGAREQDPNARAMLDAFDAARALQERKAIEQASGPSQAGQPKGARL
jgi:hypothetical protein